MLSKNKIIQKCLQIEDEEFNKEDYQITLDYFLKLDSNLKDLIIDRNLRLNNFGLILPAAEKRIIKLKKNYNLAADLKLVDYIVSKILFTLIQSVYEINNEHFNDNISDNKFIDKIKTKDNSDDLLKIVDKIKISRIKRFYDSQKFDTEFKLKLFSKDCAVHFKFVKSWDRDNIEKYSKLISTILLIYSDLHKNSGRHEFKITETTSNVLNFIQFLDKIK